jgi:hypothetical protein
MFDDFSKILTLRIILLKLNAEEVERENLNSVDICGDVLGVS